MASGQDGIEVSPISNPPPAKRQKTTNSTSQSAATTQNNSLAYDLSYDLTYDSEADSGDELFEGFVPDTPAAASKYETQPTQIIDRSAQKLSTSNTPQKNEVQVPASSPLDGKGTPSKSISPKVYPPGWEMHSEALAKASAAINKTKTKTTSSAPLPKWPGDSDWKGSRLLPQISNGAGKKRSLAQSMAPAGTSYKPPYAAPNNVSIAIDRSTLSKASGAQPLIVNGHSTKTAITIPDDDSNSSEDEVNAAANIQPSTFKAKTASASDSFDSSDLQTSNGNSKFQSIVANAAYTGPQFGATFSRPVSSKPATANVMSSYDGVRKSTLQTNPVHALAVGEDIKLEDISDPKLRDMASRLSIAFPTISILTIRNVLFQTRGNVDDAAHYIARGSTDRLSNDNDYIDKSSQNPVQMFAPQIWKKAEPPKHEQPTYRVPQKTQMKRVLDAPVLSLQERYSSTMAAAKPDPSSVAHSDEPLAPQPLWQRAPLAPPKKKKLVQGRRNPSSPVAPDSAKKRPSPPVVPLDDSEDDSGVALEPPEADPALEAKVLKFLNTCTVEELVELTSTTKEYAMLMIESRPFKEIEEADEVQDPKKTKSGKKSLKQPIGTKIVQSIYDTFEGFDAIDVLVKNCDEIGKPLRQEMSTWGVDSFGAAKSGELDMTCFGEANSSQRDSGIGSPSSRPTSVNGDADDDVKIISSTRKKPDYIKQPEMMSTKDKDGDPLELKDYQIVGLNWLAMMYRHKLSGILADEMGLGKTLQVIALIAHLVETGIPGPHLVICPGSVVENWLREIKKFAPDLITDIYHGKIDDRREQAERILDRRGEINVVVTTYDLASKPIDNTFLRQLKPDVCVYDEGHYLKNFKSQRYQRLIRIPAAFKLLLTGTPLQNNLQELASLLAFILPEVFQKVQDSLEKIFKIKATTRDTNHAALLSEQRISRARSMLTPFILRRKKLQVLKHLEPKTLRVEYCVLKPSQKKIYDGHVEQARERARARIEGTKTAKSEDLENNPLMQLRKAAIHPLLFRRHFTNDMIEKMADILRKKVPSQFKASDKREHLVKEMQLHSDSVLHMWCSYHYPCISSFDTPDLAWMDSGKVDALIKLVKQYKENGDRVLIFSQFSLVLDILELVLNTSVISFMRIDGSTKIDDRQSIIDIFTKDESITAFLLTTKAGGTGLNLMAANKVIIFDGSFNPHDDKQAEDRAHRVGQKRPVEVVRLVTRDTIEEQIYALGQSKLMLDGKVSGDDEAANSAAQLKGQAEVARMLLTGEKAANDGSTPVLEFQPLADDDDDDKKEKGDKSAAAVDDAKNHGSAPRVSKGKKPSLLDSITSTSSRKPTTENDTEMKDVDEAGDEMLV